MPEQLNPSVGDGPHVVTDETGSACWQVCIGGECWRDRSGQRLMARLMALRMVPVMMPAPVTIN